MFTGIIQKTSNILKVAQYGECLSVHIKKPKNWKLQKGQSVSVDGICSTIIAVNAGSFQVEYMPETLHKTTAHSFKKNALVNLERSLTLNDFVDGGLVQGHVDTYSKVLRIEERGETRIIKIQLPKTVERYIAPIGGITVNGVNLTVAQSAQNTFTVALIPYTLKHTNLGLLQKGDIVNIEVDMVARYILSTVRNK